MLRIKHYLTLLLTFLIGSASYAQEIAKLFTDKNFSEVIKHEKDKDLDSVELYDIGFSFFALGNDEKAIEFYDRAIKGGFGVANVHFAKAVALRYVKRISEAHAEFDIAITQAPDSIKFRMEKGFTYFYLGEYNKAATTFQQAIERSPTSFDLYPYLIQAFNGAKEYAKADEYVKLMRIAYTNNELGGELMNQKMIPVSDFKWNDQPVRIYKYLIPSQNAYDPYAYAYLYTMDGKTLDRSFVIEKTDEYDFVKFRIGEYDRATKTYSTYSIGWNTDEISVQEIKDAVIQILDKKIEKCKTYNTGK